MRKEILIQFENFTWNCYLFIRETPKPIFLAKQRKCGLHAQIEE
jgi:hypothetical protein